VGGIPGIAGPGREKSWVNISRATRFGSFGFLSVGVNEESIERSIIQWKVVDL
jgi:hypothetical protein